MDGFLSLMAWHHENHLDQLRGRWTGARRISDRVGISTRRAPASQDQRGLPQSSSSYLFAEIKRRTAGVSRRAPERPVIDLGIGDVTLPLPPAVVAGAPRGGRRDGAGRDASTATAPTSATSSCARRSPRTTSAPRGVKIAADEIFVSDGSKSDSANIQEIFARGLRGGPDGSGLSGVRRQQRDGRPLGPRRRRAGATRASSICRAPPRTTSSPRCPTGRVDLIYLCYPNNPTGAVMTRDGARSAGSSGPAPTRR